MPLERLSKRSLIHNKKKKSHILSKKTSLQEVPESISFSGSLTIEASLVFPFCLFVFITLLSFFRILQTSYVVYGVLTYVASEYSLDPQGGWESEIPVRFSQGLKQENCNFILGKEEGIHWNEQKTEGEYVELQITYECKLPIDFFSVKSISVCQGIRIKKWTGFQKNPQDTSQEVWVYVTPSGQVYHKTKDCTHLKLSIQWTDLTKALQEGYTRCLSCGNKEIKDSLCYVAEEGRRYHSTLSCSGLKRTVYRVKYEEVSDLRPCQRCGGIQ